MDDDGSTPIPNPTILSVSIFVNAPRHGSFRPSRQPCRDLCSYPGVSSAPLHRSACRGTDIDLLEETRVLSASQTKLRDTAPALVNYKWLLLARRKTRRAKSAGVSELFCMDSGVRSRGI